MNRKIAGTIVVLLYLFVGFGATAQVRSALPRELTIEDHLFILDLKEASPPRVLEQRKEIVFTYLPAISRTLVREQGYQNQLNLRENAPMRVSIAFGHEQFRTLYPMDRSPAGVYFFYFSYTRDFLEQHRSLEYRFVVNGVWMEDPSNPQFRSTVAGTRISQISLPESSLVPDSSPLVLERIEGRQGRVVRFVYQGPTGKDIYVAGSFNAWDPYLHKMTERHTSPGLYELVLHLPPGTHHYHFVSSGQRALDPLNMQVGSNSEGIVYSRFTVPN